MTVAEALTTQLQALCPIDGVSIGDAADKATWRIDFAEGATDAQKAAAQGALRDFDPEASVPASLSKLSIVDRLTDAELGIFLALRSGTAATALPLAPADQIRLALRWDNAATIDPRAQDVRQGLAAVFSTTRMAELLRP
jgi:hypothetical protein